MAERYLICQGDKTSHGGTVLEGAPFFTVEDRPVECVSHKVSCPQCGGVYPIIEGASNVDYMGMNAAVDGMRTACGAVLISSQRQFSVEVVETVRHETWIMSPPASHARATPQPASHQHFSTPNSAYAEAVAYGAGASETPVEARFNGEALGEAFSEPIRLFQIHRRPGLAVDGKSVAPDLVYGDKTKEEILALASSFRHLESGSFSKQYIQQHFTNMALLFATASWGDLSGVALKWVERFADNRGGSFYSTVLTEKVKNHENTQKFVESVRKQIYIELNRKYNGNNAIINTIMSNMQNYIMAQLRLPKFNNILDRANGLTILIHDVWAVDIELTDYSIDNKHYTGNLRFSIFDHFGLDDGDVSAAEGKGFHIWQGFRSWYILQHYEGFAFKPFITKIYFDVPIEGVLTGNEDET